MINPDHTEIKAKEYLPGLPIPDFQPFSNGSWKKENSEFAILLKEENCFIVNGKSRTVSELKPGQPFWVLDTVL